MRGDADWGGESDEEKIDGEKVQNARWRGAADGVYHIMNTFSNPVYVVLYLVWLGALWFHLTHGFWSSMQSLGWNNKIWINRWKCISNIYSTIVVVCFALVVVVFFVKSLACGAC